MGNVLIIGTGGVGSVVAKKCRMLAESFGRIDLANRSLEKAEALMLAIGGDGKAYQLDADNIDETVALLERTKPDLVINTALPYQDLAIMEACLRTKIDYLDTANYEHPDEAKFEYKEQWAYHKRFKEAGIMALLGCGFDPGVTSAFVSYARKHLFDKIKLVDIVDANDGDHGQPFATNFNPEINIREVTAEAKYWQGGKWHTAPALKQHRTFSFPEIGPKDMYLMYHEEIESLKTHFPEIERIRFWMTFSEQYLQYLSVLQSVGMTSIKPVMHNGQKIIPLQFLKDILPEPSSLGSITMGKICIGCIMEGEKDGNPHKVHIYSVKDHQECFAEVGSQAVSYTTGVPAMIGAKLMLEGKWRGEGVFNIEQLDPDVFMEELNQHGLPWQAVTY